MVKDYQMMERKTVEAKSEMEKYETERDVAESEVEKVRTALDELTGGDVSNARFANNLHLPTLCFKLSFQSSYRFSRN